MTLIKVYVKCVLVLCHKLNTTETFISDVFIGIKTVRKNGEILLKRHS